MRLLEDMPERTGYLLEDRVTDVAVLLDALRRVLEGECVLDPTIVFRLLRRPRERNPLDEPTGRELEVLALMAEGRSNTAVAERLAVSPRTLEAHIGRLPQRLGLPESPDGHRRVLAVLHSLRATTP